MGLAMLEGKDLLVGKKIVVTGSAGGIGSATVDELVRQGAVVYAIDIKDELGQGFVDDANSKGYSGKAIYAHCDCTVKEDVEKTFHAADDELGGFDVLIHCAAKMQPMKNPEDFTFEDFRFIFDEDMWGTILVDQVAREIMAKYDGGAIINYSSETALAGNPIDGLYSSAKAGVHTWTRCIATAWGHAHNIRCNSIMPCMKTPMYRDYVNNMPDDEREAFLASRRLKHPIKGDMGDPDVDIAPVMVFLSCEMSQYITGQIFCVNGGNAMVRG
ncbi:SDR family NAD(P)-dependent oxidoreductase [Ellagibacter isourolithinifaciens]|jgi:NAD(P)-dependent dehydrogenase (short-subunit alcohol dehydrogenase family)|uniref:SDR family NAD(P)-dependent oxidoreductase n=1 Tax=Ellagibacter isourolithinifaciens TaxID=2137581 RepID=UPI003A91AE70